jgi:hypothetical protein
MVDLPAAWERRITELLTQLDAEAPMTEEDYRQGAVIFASASPAVTRTAA